MVQASFDQQKRPADADRLGSHRPRRDAIAPFNEVDVLGLNCAFGPSELAETIRFIAENWPRLVSALPNAGPAGDGRRQAHFPMTPQGFHQGNDALRRGIRRQHRRRMLRDHCRASEDALRSGRINRPPKKRERRPSSRRYRVSMRAEDIRQDNSYLIVAERTNTNGSRQFKRLLQEEDWDGLVGMARDEMRDGWHMLDVCVDFVGRDGVARHARSRVARTSTHCPARSCSTAPTPR